METADRLGVVFVHGFLSGPQAWEPFSQLIASDPELKFVAPLLFCYESPRLPRAPWRRIPSMDDIAESLKTFLELKAADFPALVLVGHSQGGLVIQRYLAWMLGEGRGQELARIRHVVLFACPNDGSEFARSWRRRWLRWNAQDRQLHPLNEQVKHAQKTVLTRVVHATGGTDVTYPIPVVAYAGESDGIVTPASAHSVFPDTGALPGDHSTVIRPDSHSHLSYQALKQRLKVAIRDAEALTGTATSTSRSGLVAAEAVMPVLVCLIEWINAASAAFPVSRLVQSYISQVLHEVGSEMLVHREDQDTGTLLILAGHSQPPVLGAALLCGLDRMMEKDWGTKGARRKSGEPAPQLRLVMHAGYAEFDGANFSGAVVDAVPAHGQTAAMQDAFAGDAMGVVALVSEEAYDADAYTPASGHPVKWVSFTAIPDDAMPLRFWARGGLDGPHHRS